MTQPSTVSPATRSAVRTLHLDPADRPFIVIWEVTRACALACAHCRADAITRRNSLELSTAEGKALLDDLASLGAPRPIVVLTGGGALLPGICDLAVEVFMGGAPGASQERIDLINKSFIDCVQAATALVRYPVPGGRWHRGIVGRRRLEEFLREYLPARRAGDGEDIFSVLCRVEVGGERFSDDDVINHMFFLLMAAHDTSTITLSTMMQYLGQHPEWQERCREESLALGTDSLEYGQLKQLASLDLVMKESLRLVSPVPAIVRKTVKDTEVLGHFIPADTMVAISPSFTHHMEEYWPNPEAFDPGRFSAERKEDKVHRMAWEPFGGGVHKCIGLHFAGAEIKIVLHHLLRNFEWHVDPEYQAPIDLKVLPFPKDGQPVRLTRLPRG